MNDDDDLRNEMERRFGELRTDMAQGFGDIRVEMHQGFGTLRAEIGSIRVETGSIRVEIRDRNSDLLKWALVFALTQMAAIGGLVSLLR